MTSNHIASLIWTSLIEKLYKWSKYKKLFFSASERARTVLNAFLECMYFDKMTVKTKKLFFSASERPRTVLNAFLECMYFDKMNGIFESKYKKL